MTTTIAIAPTINPRLAAALEYAALGLPVFPLRQNRKVPPKGTRGFHEATLAPDRIRNWWAVFPRFNVGIAIPNGFFVVDLDVKDATIEDRIEALRACGIELPMTLTAETPSGGRHLWYRLPPGVTVRQTAGELAPGVDTRAAGKGYVVAPPSVVDGRPYRWLTEPGECVTLVDLIEDAPPALVEALKPRPRGQAASAASRRRAPSIAVAKAPARAVVPFPENAPTGAAEAERAEALVKLLNDEEKREQASRWLDRVQGSAEGSRNSDGFRLAAAMLIDFDLSFGDARTLIESWNRRGTPPMTSDEAEQLVANAQRYGSGTRGSKLRPVDRLSEFRQVQSAYQNSDSGSADEPSESLLGTLGAGNRTTCVKPVPIGQRHRSNHGHHRVALVDCKTCEVCRAKKRLELFERIADPLDAAEHVARVVVDPADYESLSRRVRNAGGWTVKIKRPDGQLDVLVNIERFANGERVADLPTAEVVAREDRHDLLLRSIQAADGPRMASHPLSWCIPKKRPESVEWETIGHAAAGADPDAIVATAERAAEVHGVEFTRYEPGSREFWLDPDAPARSLVLRIAGLHLYRDGGAPPSLSDARSRLTGDRSGLAPPGVA